MKFREQEIFARTLYGEARGEFTHVEGGLGALIAVGNVVVNRAMAKGWYGHTIADVCQKPWQFSCWNVGDPNRKILLQGHISDSVYEICCQVAGALMTGDWPDLTGGCTHYHATTMAVSPGWAKGHTPRLKLGRHVFYRL